MNKEGKVVIIKTFLSFVGAVVLAAAMLLSAVPLCAQETPIETDPYVFVHDGGVPYWHRSPHRYAWTGGVGYIPSIYRLAAAQQMLPAYCCDLMTQVVPGTRYRRLELEDAGYYSADAAAHIRGILNEGYWVGRDNLAALALAADAQGLTAAEALTATQCAIWHYANGGDVVTQIYSGTRSVDSAGVADPVTVNVQEGGAVQTTLLQETALRIEKVYTYLLTRSAPKNTEGIWAFTSAPEVMAMQMQDGTFHALVRCGVKGEGAGVTLTVTLTNGAGQQVARVSAEPSAAQTGILFEGLSPADVQGGLTAQLVLSGTQTVQAGFYFYEPEGGRAAAQCFVGYGAGETPVHAAATGTASSQMLEFSLYKYDKDMPAQGETAVETPEGAFAPVAGAVFQLYVQQGNEAPYPHPLAPPQTTDATGRVVWQGLAAREGTRYFCKEVVSPAGYAGSDALIPLEGAVALVENCHDKGNVCVTKSVEGGHSDGHFPFSVEVDLSTADLVTGGHYSVETLAARYTQLPLSWQGVDHDGGTHGEVLQLETGEGGILYGEVALAHGESLVVSGLPAGARYTFKELDEGGAPLEEGQLFTADGLLFAAEEPIASGTVREKPCHTFVNTLYERTQVSLSGEKRLDGLSAVRPFTFELYAEDGTLLDTAQNDGLGVFRFKPLVFEAAGSHSYTVRERREGGGFVYDEGVFRVTVTVVRDDEARRLVALAPVAMLEQSDAEEPLVFFNKTLPRDPVLPKTGQLWWPVGLLVCCGAGALLLAGRRR